jgi:hypothetical protein
MEIFDELKKKAKDAANKIDWDDLNKKKDAAIEGAKQIKDDYEAWQRQKKEDWLYKKESELKELEDTLKQREMIIRQKEIKLSQKFFLRFVLFAGGFSLIGIFVLSATIPPLNTNKQEATAYVVESKNKTESSSLGISSSDYTPREKAVYGTYNDLNTTDPNFDVGGYCLEKERRGGISFEECLSVAAAKLMSK